MRDLNINIKKARIEGFSVTLREDRPVVEASISLLTEGGKKITSYSLGSQHWEDSLKFDLPHEIVQPILDIARILERVVTDHAQSSALRLAAPVAVVDGFPDGIPL
jgi:hypothetical protein